MVNAIALTKHALDAAPQFSLKIVRSAIVLGFGAALIFAGQPLPL